MKNKRIIRGIWNKYISHRSRNKNINIKTNWKNSKRKIEEIRKAKLELKALEWKK